MSFNYGSHGAFGAVGHWGGPDIGWVNSGGAPSVGQWHHLAYTYDGTTTRVYDDGVLANEEILGGGVINTHPDTAILIGSQMEGDGLTLTGGLRLTDASIGGVRIHDGVLSDAQLLNNYNEEAGNFLPWQDASGHLPPPPPMLQDADPPIGNPVYYNNMVLFELRSKAEGNQGDAELYRLNDNDANNDGVPDDPNVLMQDNMNLVGLINGGPNTYGEGWSTGTTGIVVDINGVCCANDSQIDDLVINNSFQIWDDDGIFEFTEDIDDRVHVSINGTWIHSDGGWNVRTEAVWNDDDGQGGGWYDVVIHSVEDGGGEGFATQPGIGFNNTIGQGTWQVINPSYVGDTSPDGVSYRAVLDTIPEPGTVTLALIGFCCLAFRRRRARRVSA